ncbi:hypothetical protein O5286_02205 [Escherichia coli]|nr:hypothetical protein [Escherichia coli]
MHSNYDSVQEQTGIFAGRGGFDVTTGQHTQLNGAVIASTATADKNRLDTGTLGFSDIENRADFKTEHQSAGLSTGGSVAGNFLGTWQTICWSVQIMKAMRTVPRSRQCLPEISPSGIRRARNRMWQT